MGGLGFGIAAALLGNCIIGAGQCLQKYAINQVQHQRREYQDRQHVRSHSPELSASKGHNHLPPANDSSANTAPSRFTNRYWILGLSMCYLGEVCGNWIGLMFASAASITPLGIVSVLVNALIASIWLREPWTAQMKRGYLLIAVGVLVILSVAPRQAEVVANAQEHELVVTAVEQIATRRQWIHYLTHSWFQPTVLMLIALSIAIIYKILLATSNAVNRRGPAAHRLGKSSSSSVLHTGGAASFAGSTMGIYWFVAAASVFGGITVLSSKMVSCILRVMATENQSTGKALSDAGAASVHDILHHNQTIKAAVSHNTTAYTPEAAQAALFILLITLVGSIIGQEVFKQQALSRFPVSQFQPLFYAAYNSIAVLSSVFAFQELPPVAASWLWFITWFTVGMAVITRGSLEVGGGSGSNGDRPIISDPTDFKQS